jgi:hypothetical protein
MDLPMPGTWQWLGSHDGGLHSSPVSNHLHQSEMSFDVYQVTLLSTFRCCMGTGF